LSVAAITHVFTLARVAELLGEDEEPADARKQAAPALDPTRRP